MYSIANTLMLSWLRMDLSTCLGAFLNNGIRVFLSPQDFLCFLSENLQDCDCSQCDASVSIWDKKYWVPKFSSHSKKQWLFLCDKWFNLCAIQHRCNFKNNSKYINELQNLTFFSFFKMTVSSVASPFFFWPENMPKLVSSKQIKGLP